MSRVERRRMFRKAYNALDSNDTIGCLETIWEADVASMMDVIRSDGLEEHRRSPGYFETGYHAAFRQEAWHRVAAEQKSTLKYEMTEAELIVYNNDSLTLIN